MDPQHLSKGRVAMVENKYVAVLYTQQNRMGFPALDVTPLLLLVIRWL